MQNLKTVKKETLSKVLAMNDKAIKLASDHWQYLKCVLETHGLDSEQIKIIGFHYQSSMVHGFKHGLEEIKLDK